MNATAIGMGVVAQATTTATEMEVETESEVVTAADTVMTIIQGSDHTTATPTAVGTMILDRGEGTRVKLLAAFSPSMSVVLRFPPLLLPLGTPSPALLRTYGRPRPSYIKIQ